MSFVSTVSTYIALNALEILMPSVDSVNIYSIDCIVEKPSVSAFQNFLRIENQLNIKKLWAETCVLNIGSIRIYILTTGVVSNETNTYVRMYI